MSDEIRKSMGNFTIAYIMMCKRLLHLPVLFVDFTIYTGTIHRLLPSSLSTSV